MKPVIQRELDALSARIDALEALLRRTIPGLSGSIDGHFNQLSGTVNAAIQGLGGGGTTVTHDSTLSGLGTGGSPLSASPLSGTCAATDIFLAGSIGSVSTSVTSLSSTVTSLDLSVTSLSGSVDGHFNQLSGTVNARFVDLSGTIDGHFNALSGFVSRSFFDKILNPTQVSGTTNDWNPGPLGDITLVRYMVDASRNINGLVSGSEGRIVCLCNVTNSGSAAAGNFNHESATSTNVNRFRNAGLATKTGGAAGSVWYRYDSLIQRWVNVMDTQ